MTLGFLGFGEVGYYMSRGLKKAGFGRIIAYDKAFSDGGSFAGTIGSRADEAGVELVSSLQEMLKQADVIISALPAKYSLEAVKELLGHSVVARLFVDVSTAKPEAKKKMEELFGGKEIKFADGAMLGPLPTYGHTVPVIASGSGAAEWAEMMTPFGMKIELVEGPAGAASSIKLVRSVFMKGLEALLVETFLFAKKSGAEDIVLESIAETLKVPFQNTAQRMIAADLVHAERRAFEVGESIDLMKDLGIEPVMAEAIVKRLKKSAALGTRDELGGVPPKTLPEVYEIWKRKNHC
jgi:3-hydroxyisobutyrate dehydrogenase-like beta-hydroxyacid dehydrogenase